MTFTDDDLKRLKKAIAKDIYGCEQFLSVQRVKALLARLEKSEACFEYLEAMLIDGDATNAPYVKEIVEAWRKSSGKAKK